MNVERRQPASQPAIREDEFAKKKEIWYVDDRNGMEKWNGVGDRRPWNETTNAPAARSLL